MTEGVNILVKWLPIVGILQQRFQIVNMTFESKEEIDGSITRNSIISFISISTTSRDLPTQ